MTRPTVDRGDVHSTVVRLLELVQDWRRYEDGTLPAAGVDEITIVLEGLDHDLASRERGLRCAVCGLRFRWPGELDDHGYRSHPQAYLDSLDEGMGEAA